MPSTTVKVHGLPFGTVSEGRCKCGLGVPGRRHAHARTAFRFPSAHHRRVGLARCHVSHGAVLAKAARLPPHCCTQISDSQPTQITRKRGEHSHAKQRGKNKCHVPPSFPFVSRHTRRRVWTHEGRAWTCMLRPFIVVDSIARRPQLVGSKQSTALPCLSHV